MNPPTIAEVKEVLNKHALFDDCYSTCIAATMDDRLDPDSMVIITRDLLAAALAPWLAEFKAGVIGSFSQAPCWDERTQEDRDSWMPGAIEDATYAADAILVVAKKQP